MTRALIPLLAVALVAGCGSDNEDPATNAAQTTQLPPPQEPEALTVGDAATVPFGEGGQAKVTVTEVEDPLSPPADDMATSQPAAAGSRYVAVHTTLENTGSVPYADSLYGAAQLIDTDGNVVDGVQLLGWSCEGVFSTSIATGARAKGCEVYELADGVEPGRFVLLDQGSELAAWELGS